MMMRLWLRFRGIYRATSGLDSFITILVSVMRGRSSLGTPGAKCPSFSSFSKPGLPAQCQANQWHHST